MYTVGSLESSPEGNVEQETAKTKPIIEKKVNVISDK